MCRQLGEIGRAWLSANGIYVSGVRNIWSINVVCHHDLLHTSELKINKCNESTTEIRSSTATICSTVVMAAFRDGEGASMATYFEPNICRMSELFQQFWELFIENLQKNSDVNSLLVLLVCSRCITTFPCTMCGHSAVEAKNAMFAN